MDDGQQMPGQGQTPPPVQPGGDIPQVPTEPAAPVSEPTAPPEAPVETPVDQPGAGDGGQGGAGTGTV